jgi:hypothetical protein
MPGLIQANQTLWEGPARRMLLVKWALCAALLTGIIASPNLWTSDRAFPTIPALPGLPDLPQAVCVAFVGLLIISGLAVALLPNPRLAIWALAFFATVLVLFDINRLQPWFYQYVLMLLGISLMTWDDPLSNRSGAAWGICAAIVACIYFWSGLQKANLAFAYDVFPWLLKPVTGDALLNHLRPFWFLAPLVETSIGVLLIVPGARSWALGGAVLMHSFLILALGPFGLRYNSVVWPWNFFLLLIDFILFARNFDPVLRTAWSAPLGKGLLILMGILPALNFIDRWDTFPSASYYSGRYRDAWIYLTAEGFRRFPITPQANRAVSQETPDRFRIDVTLWGLSIINVPPYGEPRTYREMIRKLALAGVPPSEMSLYVRVQHGPGSVDNTYTRLGP